MDRWPGRALLLGPASGIVSEVENKDGDVEQLSSGLPAQLPSAPEWAVGSDGQSKVPFLTRFR